MSESEAGCTGGVAGEEKVGQEAGDGSPEGSDVAVGTS